MGRRVLQRGPSGDVDFGSGEPGVSSGEDSRVDGCKEDAMDTGVFVYVYSQRGLALAGAACDLRCWLCYCCGRCMGALAAWQAYTKFMPPPFVAVVVCARYGVAKSSRFSMQFY